MAIDFLILILLFISFTINLLALGAFCMTPSLRTTAGRFVINLLIINIAGCWLLASTLFFIGNTPATAHPHNNADGLAITTKEFTSDHHRRMKRTLQDNGILNEIKQSEYIFKLNSNHFGKLTIKDKLMQDDEKTYNYVAVNPIFETSDERRKVKSNQFMRLWSIDLAAALGGLSVLVVVGDTWMAVRDPLQYHRRVTKKKAWILIALNWALGILFGSMSAYWQLDFEEIGKKNSSFSGQIQFLNLTFNVIFSKTFAYIYFVMIILLPFGFVCGMYWRIVCEAKGLRTRTNIPLLTSLKIAANLSRNQQQQKRISPKNTNLPIDSKKSFIDEKAAESHPEFLKETAVEEINPNKILLNNCPSVSGEINKNYSLRPLLKKSSQNCKESDRLFQVIRQIYSTPNFQKYNQGHGSFLTRFDTTSNLRHMSYQALKIRNTTHITPDSTSYITSIRQRISHASSIFYHREESRAARISISVILMFFVSYLPYGFLGLLHGSQMLKNFSYSIQLAIFMILLANLSSPFIFAYRNKHVRHGVTRLFGFDNRSKKHCLQHKCIFLR